MVRKSDIYLMQPEKSEQPKQPEAPNKVKPYCIVQQSFSAKETAMLMGLLPVFFHHWLIEFLICDVLLFIGTIFLLYRFRHLLLKNRAIAKIITFTSLTRYKFWGRYYYKK
jgi:hypothetical protein